MTSSHEHSDIESTVPSVKEEESFHGDATVNAMKADMTTLRKLSTVSKKYDIDGDGELDDAELAMRVMDKSNRGYLTNEKVYNIIREQNETNKKLFKTRRIATFLMVLVVLLALANLGTSFAAAHLAKDTVVNQNEEVQNKATGETLSQQSTTDDIEMDRTNSIAEDGTRRLCKKKDGEVTCNPDSFYSIDWKMCKRMVKHCKRGNTVSMSRTWPNGDQSRFQVCPFEGTMSKWRRSTLVNHVGKKFEFEQVNGMHCRLGGDAILQEKDEICSVDGECVPGLVCVEDLDQIKVCKSICRRRRWVQRLADECVENCQITTCEEADIFDD